MLRNVKLGADTREWPYHSYVGCTVYLSQAETIKNGYARKAESSLNHVERAEQLYTLFLKSL